MGNNGYYSLQDKEAKALSRNPFVTTFYYHSNFYEEIPKLGMLVEKLKEDEYFSKSEILYAMFEYARIYEQFRPNKITKDDVYFGTVKKMDGIYFTIFKYLDADLLITFSRSPSTDLYMQFEYTSKKTHSEINWEMMIDDIQEINKAILITMEDHAVDLYCILRNEAPHYIDILVEGFILRYGKNIKKEDIKFQNDSIIIKNKNLDFMDHHQLFKAVLEIDLLFPEKT